MPMWGRIPCAAVTSALWTCVLSAMRGGDVVHGDEMIGGSISGSTMKLMEEGLEEIFSTSVDYDKSFSHVCVSAAGPDRVGWVSNLAAVVAEGGANITHSKMLRLGDEFTILMHVAVPPEKVRTLISSLNSNKDLKPLNIRTSYLTSRQTGMYTKALTGLRIHCVGTDRPGMLAAVAKKISEEKLSVENITTELRIDRATGKIATIHKSFHMKICTDSSTYLILI